MTLPAVERMEDDHPLWQRNNCGDSDFSTVACHMVPSATSGFDVGPCRQDLKVRTIQSG